MDIIKSFNQYKTNAAKVLYQHGKLAAVHFLHQKKMGFKLHEIKEYVETYLADIDIFDEYDKLKADNEKLLDTLWGLCDKLEKLSLWDKTDSFYYLAKELLRQSAETN